jgi:hypothetical protein
MYLEHKLIGVLYFKSSIMIFLSYIFLKNMYIAVMMYTSSVQYLNTKYFVLRPTQKRENLTRFEYALFAI